MDAASEHQEIGIEDPEIIVSTLSAFSILISYDSAPAHTEISLIPACEPPN